MIVALSRAINPRHGAQMRTYLTSGNARLVRYAGDFLDGDQTDGDQAALGLAPSLAIDPATLMPAYGIAAGTWFVPVGYGPRLTFGGSRDARTGSRVPAGPQDAVATSPAGDATAPATVTAQAAPTPGLSLIYKGFNYVADIDGSYQDAAQNTASLSGMISSTNANAVALTEDYGIDAATSTVYADYSTASTTGNTETLAALASTIQTAESLGLSVMVRPLIDFTADATTAQLTAPDGTVYADGDWRATYVPDDISAFFTSYDTMIVAQAKVAQANGAQLFCIGTELDQLTGPAYLSYWTTIINDVRAVFSGKLTYSAISDDDLSYWQYGGGAPAAGTGDITTQVSFWSQLDYVGIDEYAAISDVAAPTEQQLVDGWTQTPTDPTSDKMTGGQSLIQYYESVAAAIGKPLLFTELGYNSAPDAASQPFFTSSSTYDPTLQANLYQAFLTAWQEQGNSSLEGVYIWYWEPDPSTVGAGVDPTWTPQGNAGALEVLAAGFAACYAAGTRIATPGGEIPIERLAIGDRVVTASGAARPIRWIGRRSYDARFIAGNRDILPVMIRAGALADGVPRRDLLVSPRHALFIDGVLIPAERLINGVSVVQPDAVAEQLTYCHLELDSHDILLAEGAPAESFVDCDSRMVFQNAHEFAALYPDGLAERWRFCAERLEDGVALETVRRRIAGRAGLGACHVEDAADAGVPDGRIDVANHIQVGGWAFDPARPHTPLAVEILVDGVVDAVIVANQSRADLARAGKGPGRCAFSHRFVAPLAGDRGHAIAVRLSPSRMSSPSRILAASVQPARRPGMTGHGPLDGRIDVCDRGRIAGWAFDAAWPERPVQLEILRDAVRIGAVLADRYRGDLAAAGKGSGCCSFVFDLAAVDVADATISVRRAADGVELPGVSGTRAA